jgi:hypothetical protein
MMKKTRIIKKVAVEPDFSTGGDLSEEATVEGGGEFVPHTE